MFFLNEQVLAAVNKSIFITGACRTGTSMMANLLSSCRDVELAFEPPLLWALFPMISEMQGPKWKLLFRSYLFEDFLMQALDGRRLNFNKNDDSCVYNSKPYDEIDHRLCKSNSRIKTYQSALTKRIAFKLPEMTPYLAQFRELFPKYIHIIFMVRSPASQINSLLRMKWFSDDEVEGGMKYFWLYRNKESPYIPFWLPEDDTDKWLGMSELERCCYYYQLMCSEVPEDNRCVIINYDAFVLNPKNKFQALAERLGCEQNAITENILATVKKPDHHHEVDFCGISPELMDNVFDLYSTLQRRSI